LSNRRVSQHCKPAGRKLSAIPGLCIVDGGFQGSDGFGQLCIFCCGLQKLGETMGCQAALMKLTDAEGKRPLAQLPLPAAAT